MKRTALFGSGAALLAVVVVLGAGWGSRPPEKPQGDDVRFLDVAVQAREFIGYNSSITLTRAQERVKRQALSDLPAPCCSNYSAYTCCCPCNMAKTIWGLSNYLIDAKGYRAEQVRDKVSEWVRFINPDGFSGQACFTGGCNRPFADDGCGGMSEARLVLD